MLCNSYILTYKLQNISEKTLLNPWHSTIISGSYFAQRLCPALIIEYHFLSSSHLDMSQSTYLSPIPRNVCYFPLFSFRCFPPITSSFFHLLSSFSISISYFDASLSFFSPPRRKVMNYEGGGERGGIHWSLPCTSAPLFLLLPSEILAKKTLKWDPRKWLKLSLASGMRGERQRHICASCQGHLNLDLLEVHVTIKAFSTIFLHLISWNNPVAEVVPL